jgi:hypothetical protein
MERLFVRFTPFRFADSVNGLFFTFRIRTFGFRSENHTVFDVLLTPIGRVSGNSEIRERFTLFVGTPFVCDIDHPVRFVYFAK